MLVLSLSACSGGEQQEDPAQELPAGAEVGLAKSEGGKKADLTPTATPEPTDEPVPTETTGFTIENTYWTSDSAYGEDGWFIDLIVKDDKTASYRASQSGRTGFYGMIDLYELTYERTGERSFNFRVEGSDTYGFFPADIDESGRLNLYIYLEDEPVVFVQETYPDGPLAPIVGQIYGDWREDWLSYEENGERLLMDYDTYRRISFGGTMQLQADIVQNDEIISSEMYMMEVEERPLYIGCGNDEWILYGCGYSESDGADVTYEATLTKDDEVIVRFTADYGEYGESTYFVGYKRAERLPLKAVNNGEYFLKVGNKVYYRVYGEDSLEKTALFGDFVNNPVVGGGNSSIYAFDETMESADFMFSDNGFGPLYYMNGRFYLTRYKAPGCIETYSVDELGENEISYGGYTDLKGVSPDYDAFAYEGTNNSGNSTVTLYMGGEKIFEKSEKTKSYDIILVDGDHLIYETSENNVSDRCSYMLYSYEYESGRERCLGKAEDPADAGYRPFLPAYGRLYGNEVYIVYEVREGTGNFYSGGAVYKAVADEDNSCSLYDTNPDFYETPYVESSEEGIRIYQNKSGSYYAGSDGCMYLRNSDGSGEKYTETFIPCGYEGSSVHMESPVVTDINGIIYMMAEYSVYSPSCDVGWRMAYRHTGTTYYRFDPEAYMYWTLNDVYYRIDPVDAMCWLTDETEPVEAETQAIIYQEWCRNEAGDFAAAEYSAHKAYISSGVTFVDEKGNTYGYKEFIEDMTNVSSQTFAPDYFDPYYGTGLPSDDKTYASGFYRLYIDELGYVYYIEKLQ